MPVLLLAPLASLGTLLGGWGVVRYLQGRPSVMRDFSGVAAGYLLATALLAILPEALSPALGGERNAVWILAGYLLIHVLEHGITPHFHYGEETHHVHGGRWVGFMALLGLSLHSLMDGVALSAASQIRAGLGSLVFLGILLHRIPEGGTIASIFLVRGYGRKGAMVAAGVLAAAALLGAAGQELLRLPEGPMLAMSGGLALYVASSDLLPEVQKESGWRSTLTLVGGAALFALASRLAPHHG